MNAFNYVLDDFIPSELSGTRAVDIHHIDCKGMGGTGKEDRIENLMAVTRQEHLKYGDKKHHMVFLYESHRSFLLMHGVHFEEEYFELKIQEYS